MAQTIDVDELIDGRRSGGFTVGLLALALLALIADGYDVQVMSFSAPSLVRAWHVNRAELGPVFSASLLGILVGAPLFGWLGDRIGRKRCVVIGSVLYGLLSLACLLATSLDQLMALRFLTGVGLGGVMPNVIALTAELAPRRLRPALTALVMVGVTLGGIVPGLIAARLGTGETWRALFLVGGLAPLAVAALMALLLPESPALLVRRGAPQDRIARLMQRIAPDADIAADARFTVKATPQARGGLSALFEGELKLVTPLLWLMFAASLLTLYLLSSWLPLLLEAGGFSPAMAANTNSLFQAGGIAGGVIASLLLGRFRGRLVAAMFALTLIAIAVTARAALPPAGLMAAVTACGFCLIGAQCSLNGTAGLAYPTAARAKGVGMALGVGRIGSVIGPLVGGTMVGSGVTSARDLFLLPLLPLALGLIAAVVVMGRLGGDAGEAPAPTLEG